MKEYEFIGGPRHGTMMRLEEADVVTIETEQRYGLGYRKRKTTHVYERAAGTRIYLYAGREAVQHGS